MGKTKYIDADKVIDYANQEVSSPFFSIEREGAEDVVTYKNKWAFVKQVMVGMPAADVAPRWIPVTERLPEKGSYLCTENHLGTIFVDVSCFDGKQWCLPNGNPHFVTKVLAWMPLPSPFLGE